MIRQVCVLQKDKDELSNELVTVNSARLEAIGTLETQNKALQLKYNDLEQEYDRCDQTLVGLEENLLVAKHELEGCQATLKSNEKEIDVKNRIITELEARLSAMECDTHAVSVCLSAVCGHPVVCYICNLTHSIPYSKEKVPGLLLGHKQTRVTMLWRWRDCKV